MESSSFSLVFLSLLFLPSLFPVSSASSFMHRPLCHDDERSALLQFKESFIIDMCASNNPFAYSKIESWTFEGEQSDCCLWDGVKCDKVTGRVIGLDLSSSCLYGSINSNSSLFQLVHLQSLNLAYNHFDHSPIPSILGHLSSLTHINLSSSFFSGQVPPNISMLSKLSILDLSNNDELILTKPVFGSLVQNSTGLEYLHLRGVSIPSTIPEMLANLSSLKSLILSSCGLNGEFPIGVFQLPYLKTLAVSLNRDLNGHLPEFNLTLPLQSLELSHTSFSGELPASIGNLRSLNRLSVRDCNFYGQVPPSLGNLTQLVYLLLGQNKLESQNFSALSWLGKQTKLTVLGLSRISLDGEIPTYFANLSQLTSLFLSGCQIIGGIPSWLNKMNQLVSLDLSFNQLQGSIPGAIFQLKNLERLILFGNNLSGMVELGMFLNLKKLTKLLLSGNKLSLFTNINSSAPHQKFLVLGLASCNLSHFPHFLHDQHELQWLDLSSNNIPGEIPKWVWNTSKDTLEFLDLSENFLTGFEQHPVVFPWARTIYLNLGSNMLQGSLPVPPPSTQTYFVYGNNLTGEVSSLICSLNSLYALDVSDNNLTGMLPACLGNFTASLQLLNLGGNNFHGTIPQTHKNKCNLRMLVLDHNQLEGKVPRSMANCTRLEFLILGNNQINDAFPYWLGSLQELKVLILRSNQFYGVLGNQITNFEFPKLRIIDLSHNNFSGQLPTQYFLNWNAMNISEAENLTYMEAYGIFSFPSFTFDYSYTYSMTLTNKGIETRYRKILEFFTVIDLSGNRFEGKIPESIGNLRGLRSLNLSNNVLTGHIPSSLGNLSKLESLDISQNQLSGYIPQELRQLTFLSFFNVSHNHLTGPIPQGWQFDTFPNSSYEGNSGLCGNPLSKNCGNLWTFPPPRTSLGEDQVTGSIMDFGWKPVIIGYAVGLIIGLVIGHIVFTNKRFVKLSGTRLQKMRRSRGRGCRY